MKNKSYIGISFIVLIFGIWAVPKIISKVQKSELVEIGPVPEFKCNVFAIVYGFAGVVLDSAAENGAGFSGSAGYGK